ncbi:MAG: NifU family protein [Oligoflexales bacterium]
MLRFRIQGTPNPQARKYIVNAELKTQGKISYQSAAECAHVPLAHALMSVPHVTQVHIFENVLTLTQDGREDWGLLDQNTQDVMREHIEAHDPHFEERIAGASVVDRSSWSDEMHELDAILERTLRPSLQADGGDVEIMGYENNILTVRYQGACGGCPSSMTATLDAMKQILRDETSRAIEVVVI